MPAHRRFVDAVVRVDPRKLQSAARVGRIEQGNSDVVRGALTIGARAHLTVPRAAHIPMVDVKLSGVVLVVSVQGVSSAKLAVLVP